MNSWSAPRTWRRTSLLHLPPVSYTHLATLKQEINTVKQETMDAKQKLVGVIQDLSAVKQGLTAIKQSETELKPVSYTHLFTDTEKVAGNFSAGVLDIEVNPDEDGFTTKEPMEFKNLRPMLLKNFDKELVESGDVNNLENNGQDPDNYPQDNLPIYFRPVRVENKGTLPIYIHLGMEPTGSDDKEPVLYGDDEFNINQDSYGVKDCENTLETALKIFVYKQVKNSEDPSPVSYTHLPHTRSGNRRYPLHRRTMESLMKNKVRFSSDL